MSERHVDVNAFLDLYKSELEAKTQTPGQWSVRAQGHSHSTTLPEQLAKEGTDSLVIERTLSGIDYQLAKCCNPICRDKIFALSSRRMG